MNSLPRSLISRCLIEMRNKHCYRGYPSVLIESHIPGTATVRLGYSEPHHVGYEGEFKEQLKNCPEALLKHSVSLARNVLLRSRRFL